MRNFLKQNTQDNMQNLAKYVVHICSIYAAHIFPAYATSGDRIIIMIINTPILQF